MKRVLIIEDQLEAKEMFIKQYTDLGYIIDLAETGLGAFYYINKFNYSTVIVSNDLRDLDGLWIVQYLKDKQDCRIILTSSSNYGILRELSEKIGVKFKKKILSLPCIVLNNKI